jgi:hypothetical protein
VKQAIIELANYSGVKLSQFVILFSHYGICHSKFSHFTLAISMHSEKDYSLSLIKIKSTCKVATHAKNRNCNLVFKVMLVKLQNQIEEREHSYYRDGAHLFSK